MKKKQHIFEWSEIEKYRFYQIIEFHWILKSSSIVVETFHTPILYSIKLLWELQFCWSGYNPSLDPRRCPGSKDRIITVVVKMYSFFNSGTQHTYQLPNILRRQRLNGKMFGNTNQPYRDDTTEPKQRREQKVGSTVMSVLLK